jgi:hypothetical protein
MNGTERARRHPNSRIQEKNMTMFVFAALLLSCLLLGESTSAEAQSTQPRNFASPPQSTAPRSSAAGATTWGNPQIESLEVQALLPMFGEHPVEMGMAGREQLLFDRLKNDPLYRKLFTAAFPPEQRGTLDSAGHGPKQVNAQLFSLGTVTKALAPSAHVGIVRFTLRPLSIRQPTTRDQRRRQTG